MRFSEINTPCYTGIVELRQSEKWIALRLKRRTVFDKPVELLVATATEMKLAIAKIFASVVSILSQFKLIKLQHSVVSRESLSECALDDSVSSTEQH